MTDFNFTEVHYVPGPDNIVPDFLSRPWVDEHGQGVHSSAEFVVYGTTSVAYIFAQPTTKPLLIRSGFADVEGQCSSAMARGGGWPIGSSMSKG